jgi:hypothetical protein
MDIFSRAILNSRCGRRYDASVCAQGLVTILISAGYTSGSYRGRCAAAQAKINN